jgi:hypothetical protein
VYKINEPIFDILADHMVFDWDVLGLSPGDRIEHEINSTFVITM